MMARLVKQKSIRVTGVSNGRHISHVTSDRVCISDSDNNLILTNTAGKDLHHLTDIDSGLWSHGVHTVNNDRNLIYINSEYNINKLSTDNKVKSTLIKYTAPWLPRSIYSSPSTGDLLVGMRNIDTDTAMVTRYNSTGENIQTIQHHSTGQRLYSEPIYITENHNGDIIVSDWYHHAVVVTERGGRHRFSYTGPPSGSRLIPRGICTDALSHILVCDWNTHTVQMIGKDGHFLSQIKTRQQGIDRPYSLSYDDRTQLLWVGSWLDNTVNIYRCIYGDSLTGLSLENVVCNKHPKSALSQFCMQCEVPLCEKCITSTGHRRHDIRDVEKLFHEILKGKDGNAVVMCLLLCYLYKINLNEEKWMIKYNAVAEVFKFKKIKKPSNLSNLKKYEPLLKQDGSEVTFSCEFFKLTSFLRFAKDPKFVDIFLRWAEKGNIAEFCRSWAYPIKEEEVFCWLIPQQTEQLIEKLGEDIFTHPTMQDPTIHEVVFSKLGIPVQIIMRGDKSVMNFMENLKKGKTLMYHACGMIIGCAGSGKSTLLGRLKDIDLKEILKNTTSTRGIDVQSDIFDVTDTVKVNKSNQKQRFKVRIDEKTNEEIVQEDPVRLTDGMKKLSIEETGDEKGTASEDVHDEEISHENMNIETDSLNRHQADAVLEKAEEIVAESQNVPKNLENLGILRVSKNAYDVPEKKITMVDFAGQCAYYASHQIFLSPRAFFILVLNMEKNFDDKVGEEVCSQERSIYKGWTHRDYLMFWGKSIHQYSSKKAPVLLVGTHAEKKTKQEKTRFFHEIWKTLETKDDSLHRHLDTKRMFAVGFYENEEDNIKSIEKIKLSIAEVVQQLDHWGEMLPHSWAMFENFFQEKKYLKIIKKETLLAFNEALPQELKLETDEDINVMLQFFHDIREILHYDQESLNETIILDVQWFADAFKNLITDENHAREDLCRLPSQWDQFNDTGELSDTLLSEIWKINKNEYFEHKDDIMLYMEKLGLLAKLGDKKWYVPCMNKIQFPVNSFSLYPASSILCYVFDVLPAEIFHRLVATCMQIPWSVVADGGRACIYQTAAVFELQNHNILLGMTPTEIQLQVFVIEGEVDISTCHQIKEKLNSLLTMLSKTFQADSKFLLAFKCKASGFCDNQKSSVINESEFTRPTFQCPSCPIERKHLINTKDITKYWKQVHDDHSEIPEVKYMHKVATSESTSPTESRTEDNLDKILKLLQVGTDAVRICFDKFFPKDDLQKILKDNETDIRRGTYRFQQPQLEILFPTQVLQSRQKVDKVMLLGPNPTLQMQKLTTFRGSLKNISFCPVLWSTNKLLLSIFKFAFYM